MGIDKRASSTMLSGCHNSLNWDDVGKLLLEVLNADSTAGKSNKKIPKGYSSRSHINCRRTQPIAGSLVLH